MAARESIPAPARSVLFVCLGNICRSPAAEGVMQRLVDERGLGDRVRVDSAGLLDYHTGSAADERMRAAAQRRGLALDSRARQVTDADFTAFDLLVCMDRGNFDQLAEIADDLDIEAVGSGQLRMLGSFLPDAEGDREPDQHAEVPDPYYGGADGFEHVLALLTDAMPAVLDTLLAEPGQTG